MSDSSRRFDVIGQLASLRRYARSLTRNDSDAEDLVHDALVRAYERRSSFREGGNLRAWLLALVHNTFIDTMRSSRSQAAREDAARQLSETETAAPQDHSVRLAQVKQAFLALPEEQRTALHLVAVEGLSYQEAASALGIPLGTVMSRIARARTALREMEDRSHSLQRPILRIVGGRDEQSA